MKKSIFKRTLAIAVLAMAGVIATNAKNIIPFGQLYQESWEAKYFYAQSGAEGPAEGWFAFDFDDTSWGTLTMPISSEGGLTYYNTSRPDERCRYWVRKHFTLDKINDSHGYFIQYSHDDECTLYLNGTKLFDQSGTANYNTYQLTSDQVKLLQKGDNVLCMYVNDSGGGVMYLDFGLYEDEGNFQEIVTTTDIPIMFTNDKVNPWFLNGTNANNGNRGKTYSASSLQMAFHNTKVAELKFDWYKYRYSNGGLDLQLYIDGVLVNSTTNSSWNTPRYYLQPGEHVVVFRDTIGSSTYDNPNSGVKNIQLREILPLETAVLTEKSQALTFANNSATPWTIEDGYIEHNNYGVANTGSSFSTTFTVDKTSKLSFDRRVTRSDNNYNYEDRHNLFFYINGVQYQKDWNNTDFTRFVVSLEPGTYTVEWLDTIYGRTETYYSQIKNIELSNNWVNVELATAGTLGYEVLYSPGVDVLNDVEFLKVTGPMNASDWTDIKNMTNLLALDLSEANITELPNQVFDGKSLLSSVILPEGLKTIGEYAFRGTTIRKMNIPSTVQTIGQHAFESTPLAYLTFADNSQMNVINPYAFNNCTSLQSIDFGSNSQLATIGERAFSSCTTLKSVNFGSNSVLTTIGRGAFAWCYALTEVQIPNTVTEVWYGAFQNCSSMKNVVFSDAMTIIRDHVCADCTSLEQVHMPVGLTAIHTRSFMGTASLKEIDIPATVNEIRSDAFYLSGIESVKLPVTLQYLYRYAFSNCKSLRYVELPSYLERGVSLGYYESYYSADGSRCYYDDYRHYGYRYSFIDCTALETVVMRAATPPTIDEDPFSGASAKSSITLVVPSFAVVNYKLDTYWYQFGTITEGDDVDYWKVTSPLMLTNNRRMQGKPDVDLYYGGQLTVGGNAPMTMGQFNMFVNESDPGRLLNTCEDMTADAVTTRFSVEANKWYFFTPMHDVAVADITVSNNASYVFRYYDAQNRAVNGATGSWKNVDSDKLLAGQGYIFHCNTACEITFPANADGQAQLFNTKDVSRTLTVNESATSANRSWNYVGNPYPAYYDIYYMDFTAPITVWTGSTYKAYSVADDEFVLRPMQSFFVQKPDAVDKIIFHKEGRQLTTSIAHGASAREAQRSKRHIFNFGIFNNNQNESEEMEAADETRVVINEEASLDYELDRDAAKFMSFNAMVPQIFTLDDEGNYYSINERPIAEGQVKLAYYVGQEGTFTIKALRTDGEVTLYDAEQDKVTDLTAEGYTFQSDVTDGINSSRFILTFQLKANDATAIKEVTDIYSQYSDLYDLQGRKVNAPTKKGIYIKNGRKVVNK